MAVRPPSRRLDGGRSRSSGRSGGGGRLGRLGVYPIALEAWTLVIMREGRAMGGRREWFKVQAALDEREWDFRTVDAACDPYYPRNAAAPAQAPGGGN